MSVTDGPTCPLCGAAGGRTVARGRDYLIGYFQDVYEVRRCPSCQVMYTWPRPTAEELAAAYSRQGLPWHDQEPVPEGRSRLRRLLGRIAFGDLRWLPPLPPGARLLDLGCGTGGFLASLRGRGWQLVGVDISEEAVWRGRQLYDLELRAGTLAEQRFPDGHFDCVCAWHVLEHLPDLQETLREIRRILRPGGWLVAAVPNAAWWGRRLFGGRWRAWWLPYHLYHFTPAALAGVLRQAGLEPTRFIFGPAQGELVASIALLLPRGRLAGQLEAYNRRISFRHPWALAIKAALLPLEYALIPLGQSHEFVLAARRPAAGDGSLP